MTRDGRKGPIANNVPISMAGGLETKVDPYQVSPPKTLVCENIRMTKSGALEKRYGLSPIPKPSTGAIDVGASNKELLVTQNGTLYAYDPDNTAWRNISPLQVATLQSKTISTLTFPPNTVANLASAPTFAIIGTTAVMTYGYLSTTNNNAYVNLTCFDVNTAVVYWVKTFSNLGRLASPVYRNASTGSSTAPTVGAGTSIGAPKVITYGGNFVFSCLQLDNLNYHMRFFSFSATQNPAQAPDFLAKTNCTVLDGANSNFPTLWLNGGLAYDVTANATDFVAVVSGGGVGTALRSNSTLPTAAAPTTKSSFGSYVKVSMSTGVPVALVVEPKAVSYIATVTGTVSGWGSSTALNGVSQTNTLPPSTALTSSVGLSLPYTSVIQDNGSATGFNFTVSDGFTVCNGTGTYASAGAPTMTTSSVIFPKMTTFDLTGYGFNAQSSVASQIFYFNGAPHMWQTTGYPGNPLTSYLLLNLVTQNVVAHTYYLRTRLFTGSTDNRAPQVHMINGVPTTILLETSNQSFNADLVGVLANQTPQYVRTPSGTLITGADTKYYDGQLLRSAGWLKIPEVGSLSITATTGGSLTPSTTYTYFFVNTDYDSQGNAISSSPSLPFTVGLSSGQNATVIDTTGLLTPATGSATNPVLEIFRNTSADQLNYHLVTQLSNFSGATYADKIADSQIAGNRLLYSPPSGGELPNDPAPPSTCGVSTKTKVFLASAEHGSWLYYSKPFFAGRAPEFNAGSFIDVEPATGDIVGLAALDEVVIIFKRKNIYLLSGTGPDATGAGTFSPIANISTDRGLVDPYSLVTTNDGVFFRTQRGIELIDRGYAISYIGSPVEGLTNGATVLSASASSSASQVRFALSTGKTVVYDYQAQAWTSYSYSVNSLPAPLQVTSQTGFASGYYLAANTSIGGQVYVENEAGWIDDAQPYSMIVQTAYVAMGGPQGWGRVRRANILGNCKDVPASVNVSFLYDYGQDIEVVPSYTISTAGAFNLRVRAPRQVCQAVSIKLTVTSASTAGESVTISDIVLETSGKSGNLRVPDTQSI